MHIKSSALIIIFVFARYLLSEWYARPKLLGINIAAQCHRDAESRLACGEKIPLGRASLDELELIPALGATLAPRVIIQREAILRNAENRFPDPPIQAMEMVHGIGPKTAKKVADYLAVVR